MDIFNQDLKSLLFNPITTPGALITAVVIFFLAWVVSRILGQLIKSWEKPIRKIFPGVDETVWRFFVHLKTLFVFMIAFALFASLVPSLRALLGTLVASAGITAIVIGFAAKSTLANLVAGVGLAVYRPVRIGDLVTIEDHYGTIEDITLRHTVILTWDQKQVVIPNEKIETMTLVNYTLTDPKMLLPLEIGVSYDTDIDLARHLILEEVKRCPHKIPDDLAPQPPWVRVVALTDFAITLRVYVWTSDIKENWLARFWILENVKKRFDREGIEIPFPYRTLVYKKDLPPARTARSDSKQDEQTTSL